MVRVQLAVIVLASILCSSSVEARGRRMVQQQSYPQYYQQPSPQYYNTGTPVTVVQTDKVVSTSPTTSTSGVVQTSAVETANAVVPANASTVSEAKPVAATPAPVVAAPVTTVGSAQWKAEQSARMGSVAHLGGGFGGGSHEGNGFGATAQQAIQNCCYWGQLTPIQIGVARGANGYYATVFYR